MTKLRFAAMALAAAILVPAASASVEFHKDIEPLLQAHCQSCHRPGEIGPMPLETYSQARPWAKSIRQAVLQHVMPPWQADSSVQHYSNDPSLSASEIELIKTWVDAGAPEGDAKLAPAPRRFTDGWNIGKPDMIVEMPEAYQIPATGTIEYTYIILPTNFKQDMWVSAMEVRPSDRAHVHHVVLYDRQADSKWLREYPKGVPFVPAPRAGRKERSSDGDRLAEGSLADEWLVGYVPGVQPYVLPPDTGFRIRAGADFVLQVHYTTNGTPGADQTRIGLVFSKTPPAHRAFVGAVASGNFMIPPGDANYSANAEVTVTSDMKLLAAGPHMHLRGKAMEMRAVYPTGESEELFDVPRYDFHWQMMYYFAEPKVLPRGTKLQVKATWDNSPNNPNNPDPTKKVHWGDQSWDEMLLGIPMLQIAPDADLNKLFDFEEPAPRASAPAAQKNR